MAEQHTPPGEAAGPTASGSLQLCRRWFGPRHPCSPGAGVVEPGREALSGPGPIRPARTADGGSDNGAPARLELAGVPLLPFSGKTLSGVRHGRTPRSARRPLSGFGLLLAGALAILLLLGPIGVAPAWAAELKVSDVRLEPCPAEDAGSQPELRRPSGASCYALRGLVTNPGRQPVVDTDVFALILDSSGEPVLPNRSRVGSIGDVPPGGSSFALRLAVPAGTPGPFEVRNARARGFKAPVRSRAAEGEELLPLEQALADF